MRPLRLTKSVLPIDFDALERKKISTKNQNEAFFAYHLLVRWFQD